MSAHPAWKQAYLEHACWKTTQLLATSATDAAFTKGSSHADQVRHLVAFLTTASVQPDPLVAQKTLTQLDAQLTNLQKSVKSWGSPNGTDSQIQTHLEGALTEVRGWRPTRDRATTAATAALDLACAAARTDVPALVSEASEKIDDGVAAALANLAQLRTDVEAQGAELARILDEASKAVVRAQAADEAAKAKTAELERAELAQVARLDKALTGFADSFQKAEARRVDEAANAAATARSEVVLVKDEAQAKAGELLDLLRAEHAEAKTLVEAVGLTATATDYGLYAQQERESANIWRKASVGAFLFSFLLFMLLLWVLHTDGTVSLPMVGVKTGGSLIMFGLGLYAARESAGHRRVERRAKTTELDLTALSPFIANMPVEKQLLIREAAARRLFVDPKPTSDVARQRPHSSS